MTATPARTVIGRVIDWCAGNRFLVFTGTIVLTLWGAWAMVRTPLDAVPDISDVQVIVSTEWPGRSPDLIEDQITYPVVTALLSAPNVRTVRGFTDFGISYVYVIFEDGTDMYWARSRVVEYLQGIRGQLPEGVDPRLGPDATGVGWVFEYALVDESGAQSLADLRGLQDWYLRYALASVPGVAEVASIGGFVKQYQVNLDPNRLAGYNLSVKQVVDAIKASNNEVEGRLLEFAGREYMVRGARLPEERWKTSSRCRWARRRRARRCAWPTWPTCGSVRTSAGAWRSSTAAARSSAASSSCASARTRCASSTA